MNLSSFIFERGRIISIYGESGVGKTLLSLQLALDIRPSVFISTEGTDFESRLEKINVGQKTYFIIVNTMLGLYNAVINSTTYHPKLLIIDTANGVYRYEYNLRNLLKVLTLLKSIYSFSTTNILLTWQVSFNNNVAGEKIMRNLSDDIMRMTKSYLIGNLRKCKFKITDKGVIGCL